MLAKLAAPGMCNPLDEKPCVDGVPTQDAIDKTPAAPPSANTTPCSPRTARCWPRENLGQHNGLPASIVVTTTLAELEAAAGRGLTGGGTILPMSDVIRLARHAHHYLAIFDKGKALALYHTKRLASPASGSSCTPRTAAVSARAARCPGYYCEVHHVTGYATAAAPTSTTSPSPAAPTTASSNPAAGPPANDAGRHRMIPPPHLERGQPRTNTFHFPERLLDTMTTMVVNSRS